MNKIFKRDNSILEKFNTNINHRVPTIVAYLLLMLILREGFSVPFPYITFFIVSFMLISSLALIFYFDRFPPQEKNILKIFFSYMMLDLFLLTLVIYYLGGVTWLGFIFYSFYSLLNFMTFPRTQALFLTIWIIFLYLGLVFFQYFKVLPFFSLFPAKTQTAFNFPYVLTTSVAYVSTSVLVAYYSNGFYQLYAKRISELRQTEEILKREKASLEERVRERKKELEKEEKGLEERIRERKKELDKEEIFLRERAEELEKFQKIAQGRELKLIKLKKELAQLKKSKI